MWSSAHVHTNYVDGRDAPRDMVLAALGAGFDALGFSEHAIQPFDLKYCMDAQRECAYLNELRSLKRDFDGKIALRIGMERDLYSSASRAPYDYVIGSVHYLPCEGALIAVDSTNENLRRLIDRSFGGDALSMARAYFQSLAGYILDYRPEIIGHFDLFCKHNGDGRYFSEDDHRFLSAGYEALEPMLASEAILEVNTGGIARGYRDRPYPARQFLRFWIERGGRLMVNSDCHDARFLTAGYEEAHALLRELGARTVWTIGEGGFVEKMLRG